MSMQWVNWVRGVLSALTLAGQCTIIGSGATQMAGHLLAPLERSVVGVRPRGGEVRRVLTAERLDAAVLPDEGELLIGLEYDAVEERHLR